MSKKLIKPDDMTRKFCRFATIIFGLAIARGLYMEEYGSGYPEEFSLWVVMGLVFAGIWLKCEFNNAVYLRASGVLHTEVDEALRRAVLEKELELKPEDCGRYELTALEYCASSNRLARLTEAQRTSPPRS